MGQYLRVSGASSGTAGSLAGVTDLLLAPTAAGARLFAIAGYSGSVYAANPAQALANAGSAARSATGRVAEGGLELLTLDDRPVLVAYGAGTATTGYRLDSGTLLTGGFSLGTGALTLLAIEALPLDGGGDLVMATSLQEAGVALWSRSAAGTMTRVGTLAAGSGTPGYDLLDLESVQVGDARFLLAVSALTHEVSVWQVDGSGTATPTDRLGARDGLAVATPSQLVTVEMDGRTLVLVAAPGTGSVTVAELDAEGRLTVLDQVNDSAGTRFQAISVLEAITLNERVFVVAGGADDGLTLMTLLPDGRLVHLETLEGSVTLPLNNPAALSLGVADGGIDLWVTDSTSAGIARLRIDQGIPAPAQLAPPGGGTLTGDARDDLLVGGMGNDVLSGGDGRDILVDGDGSDRLTGGAGADIFVLAPDGSLDRIFDFEAGIDVLDLSAFMVRDPRAITFVARADGIDLRLTTEIGTETLRLIAADREPIPTSAFTVANTTGLWHVATVVPDTTARFLQASTDSGTLLGRDGNDTLMGDNVAELLQGGAGADLLLGGVIDTAFDPEAASISRLYRATLGRAPDDPGHFSWTTLLAEGQRSLRDIAGGFIGSVEFTRTYGSTNDTAFVTLLYANVLGRAPDAAGLAGWLARLQSGSDRTDVVLGFSESAEFVRTTAGAVLDHARAGHQTRWADAVYRLYAATLDREPDAAGLRGWTALLADGASLSEIAGGFLGSVEFTRAYGSTNDTAFVTLLYANVLGRAPDAAGLAGWLARLQSGSDRTDVVLGFSESAEFVSTTAEAMQDWMRTTGEGARFDSGAGADTMVGGVGADTFVFDPADGSETDRVVGLERWDLIDLSAFGYATADEALANFSQQGGATWFRDQGTTVIFEDTILPEICPDMLIV
jgi:Ca2+-binding RTX toxin-like protein